MHKKPRRLLLAKETMRDLTDGQRRRRPLERARQLRRKRDGAKRRRLLVFPGVQIGAGARISKCILDKNVVVPPGTRLGFDHDIDRQRFTVSDRGVVVVPKGYVL